MKSSISYIDGGKGILRYRGYPIEELAERSSFLEVAYLLMYGDLPSAARLDTWKEAVMRHSALPADVQKAIDALPHDAHPMGTILTGICALSTFHPEQNPAVAGQTIYESPEIQDKQIVRLIGKVRGSGIEQGFCESFSLQIAHQKQSHQGVVHYSFQLLPTEWPFWKDGFY